MGDGGPESGRKGALDEAVHPAAHFVVAFVDFIIKTGALHLDAVAVHFGRTGAVHRLPVVVIDEQAGIEVLSVLDLIDDDVVDEGEDFRFFVEDPLIGYDVGDLPALLKISAFTVLRIYSFGLVEVNAVAARISEVVLPCLLSTIFTVSILNFRLSLPASLEKCSWVIGGVRTCRPGYARPGR